MVVEKINEIGRIKLVNGFIFLLRNQLEETEDESKRRKIFDQLRNLFKKEVEKTNNKFLMNIFNKELKNLFWEEIEKAEDPTYRTELVDELRGLLWEEIKQTNTNIRIKLVDKLVNLLDDEIEKIDNVDRRIKFFYELSDLLVGEIKHTEDIDRKIILVNRLFDILNDEIDRTNDFHKKKDLLDRLVNLLNDEIKHTWDSDRQIKLADRLVNLLNKDIEVASDILVSELVYLKGGAKQVNDVDKIFKLVGDIKKSKRKNDIKDNKKIMEITPHILYQENRKQEAMILKNKFRKDIILKRFLELRNISIDISDKCNLRCKICNQWKDSNKHKKLEFEDIKKLIDQISKFYPDVILEFSGQEPLLKKDLLFKCLEYGSKKNIGLALSTNGTLIDKKTAEQLMNLNLHHISISLDGFKEVHDYLRNKEGVFDDVVKGLELLVDIKKNEKINTAISVTTVITNHNEDKLLDFYHFLKELEIDSVNFNAYILDNSYFFDKKAAYENNEFWISSDKIQKLKEVINELIKLKEENSKPIITNSTKQLELIPNYFREKNKFKKGICFAGNNYFHITNFGEVTVCGKGPHLNIKDYSLGEIWGHPNFRKTRLIVQNCKKTCLSNCFE